MTMEIQYVKISHEEKDKLQELGFPTYNQISSKSGQQKIVGYMINLSDILAFLEGQKPILDRVSIAHKKIESVEKDIEKLSQTITELTKIAENKKSEIEKL